MDSPIRHCQSQKPSPSHTTSKKAMRLPNLEQAQMTNAMARMLLNKFSGENGGEPTVDYRGRRLPSID